MLLLTYLPYVIRSSSALCDVGVAVGETLIVSAENKPLIAIASGTLTTVTDTVVTVVTDRWVMRYTSDILVPLVWLQEENLVWKVF